MPRLLTSAVAGGLVAVFFLVGLSIVPGSPHSILDASGDATILGAIYDAHPLNRKASVDPAQLRSIPKRDRPDLAAEQDALLTMDPSTGLVPRDRLYHANMRADELVAAINARGGGPITTLAWEERGPSFVGGRTRAVMFDPNDAEGKRLFAAGVAGGLWVVDDITSFTLPWTPVNDFWENMAVTALAFDPSNTDVMYAGTGEGFFNIDAVRGAGIFQSVDGGTTWARLAATIDNPSFFFVQRIAVHPQTGDVYAATSQGIQRSQDQGATWENVRTGNASDVEIAADGTIYSATGLGSTGRVYASSTGGVGEWIQVNTGTNGFPTTGIQRVELAAAPSDATVLYAVTESSAGGGVGGMYRTNDGGTTWSALTLPNDVQYGTDFSRGQAWYDLSLEVSPTNADMAFVGGINIFRTMDGGTSWAQMSHWYGGFGYPEVHADQHGVYFQPGSEEVVVFSHDGGITFTDDATAPQPTFRNKNRGYNVTQFYAGAQSPEAGSPIMLAGAQDNGTHRFLRAGVNNSNEVRGGDGAYTFIDQDEPNIAISSYVRNTYRLGSDAGVSFPVVLIDETNTGSFINPADYDDRENILYSYRSTSSLYRFLDVATAPSTSVISLSLGGSATNLKVSPYAEAGTSTLYVGTNVGRIFRIANAESTPVVTELTRPGPGSVSSIEFGESEDRMLVTYSNYSIVSVWETLDGGMTWANKEGDLPDMPVRWALYDPNDPNLVLLATESGVWETEGFGEASPIWTPAPGFPRVSTHMLQYRPSDGQVMATTHGRGVFTARFLSSTVANAPTQDGLPGTHRLGAAYPNPFNPQTQFTLEVADLQEVRLALYDIQGRQVALLHDGPLAPNTAHSFAVDGQRLSSGTYVVAVQGERFRDQLRLSLVK